MINTERLILRHWLPEDFEPFARLNADPRVMEFFPALLNHSESDILARKFANLVSANGWGPWAVSAPGVADFIGYIGIKPVLFDAYFTPAVEIGWRLAFEYWDKGYATEGAKAALNYGFELLKLEEIVAFTVPANLRSQRVMQRLGMQHGPKDIFEHPLLPEGHPLRKHVLYRIKSNQWDPHELT